MGILAGLAVIAVLCSGFWLAAWIIIGVYLGRRWGMNEVAAALLCVFFGPFGVLGTYVLSRWRVRRLIADTSGPLDELVPASSDAGVVPDF
jgi:hypothetical protein